MGKRKSPPAVPSAESDLRGEAVLNGFTLVINMDAIDRYEDGGRRSLLDLLAKVRHPGLFGAAPLSELVDATRAAMLKFHAEDLPDREAVLGMINTDAWNIAFMKALARAFPAAGEPVPAP